jgi:hypothetical protein
MGQQTNSFCNAIFENRDFCRLLQGFASPIVIVAVVGHYLGWW